MPPRRNTGLFPQHTVEAGREAFHHLTEDDLVLLRTLARDKYVVARLPLSKGYTRLVAWKLGRIVATYAAPPYNGWPMPHHEIKLTAEGQRTYDAVQAFDVLDTERRQVGLFSNPRRSLAALRADSARHNAFVEKWQITFAGGHGRGSYVSPYEARAAGLRRLRTSHLTRALSKGQRSAVVDHFMAGPTRGMLGYVLARWLDALEHAGWEAVRNGGVPVDYIEPWRR